MAAVRTIDLTDEHLPSYLLCLEEWNPDAHEAGSRRRRWYEKMRDRGLGVKLAVDERGQVGGMIQYLPAEQSVIEGPDLYFVHCIWVHGHKQGRGDCRHQGLGRTLIESAEEDVRARGAKGLAAWGLWLPFWMKASWFKRYGFVKADREGMQVLMWKPFASDALPPRWIRPRKPLDLVPGKVTVTAFVNGWCMAMNLASERTRRAAADFGDRVAFHEIDTSDRAAVLEWGRSDAIYIDGKEVRTGPPPSYEKVRAAIARAVERQARPR
ncbi:MAG: GNAT family N-acetyltransferase [Deltaproteobacteria bacterium]|nr:GNAT family N-acetyltransferase [Deltaproteobacteria bacterium]